MPSGEEPIHDVIAFLTARFGEPERAPGDARTSQLTFSDGTVGVSVRVAVETGAVLAVSTLFGLPNPLLKPCPQSRWSGAWIVATGSASFVPVVSAIFGGLAGLGGGAAGALAAATARAGLDYSRQAMSAKPGLCQGLCTSPCWCTVDVKAPTVTENTTISYILGVPARVTVTVTMTGWVIASCEGWIF